MKRPDNTEMDRLLRRHARPGGGAVRAAAVSSGAHMDADEMNAYAEGALPDSARARYFTHLADCDSCRKLVTELTLAAAAADEGRARAAAAVTAAPSKSWRERLAAIFSPSVLRYAVPALALFAVVIVALVAMRANRDSSQVARSDQSAPNAAPGVAANTNSAVQPVTRDESGGNHATANVGTGTVNDGQPGTGSAAPAPTPAPTLAENAPIEKSGAPAGQTTQPQQTAAQTDDTRAPSREDRAQEAGKRAEVEVAAAPPPPPRPVAQEPVLAAPSSSADEARARDKEEQRQTKVAGKDDGDDVATGGAATTETQPNKGRGELGKAAGTSAAPRARANAARKRGPADAPAGNERSVETRNVGGRSFQRQGSAWVDTAYNSSRPTTNVRRGSEHYRTLVADEPGLRNITEQLGGELIVVWKSSAYRFY